VRSDRIAGRVTKLPMRPICICAAEIERSTECTGPAVVQACHSTGAGRTAETRAIRAVETPMLMPVAQERRDLSAAVSAVAWTPRGSMNVESWIKHGHQLGRLGAGSHWWLGDWIRYGTATYG
jgi:hypothetical protein